ncbi:MAG TPA: sn-glycerol-3-phosphate ABC transporter permease UgpA [Xanthobacteraceae bacterium]|nr:sn-glycerol-3-phosphate ABC transporter permease UgpA [Xanthobacteraceae bacterium]
MQDKRVIFPGLLVPLLLLAPQLAITFVFFVWPGLQSIRSSLFEQDAFGLAEQFVGAANFARILSDPAYLSSLWITIIFAAGTTALSMSIALVLAVLADRAVKGASTYKLLITLPYAVAPAIAGVLWWFLFNPTIGVLPRLLAPFGVVWNHFLNGQQALILVIIASAWKQISYNFLFYLAGLQTIPRGVLEAAEIDGADGFARFRLIVLPLLMPTTFFLSVINLVYAFCDTFAVIHATTSGGPGSATTTLVYKVFRDGFETLDLGGSAAQSVVLLVIVGALTVAQFRYIERNIHY